MFAEFERRLVTWISSRHRTFSGSSGCLWGSHRFSGNAHVLALWLAVNGGPVRRSKNLVYTWYRWTLLALQSKNGNMHQDSWTASSNRFSALEATQCLTWFMPNSWHCTATIPRLVYACHFMPSLLITHTIQNKYDHCIWYSLSLQVVYVSLIPMHQLIVLNWLLIIAGVLSSVVSL